MGVLSRSRQATFAGFLRSLPEFISVCVSRMSIARLTRCPFPSRTVGTGEQNVDRSSASFHATKSWSLLMHLVDVFRGRLVVEPGSRMLGILAGADLKYHLQWHVLSSVSWCLVLPRAAFPRGVQENCDYSRVGVYSS